MSNNNQLRKLKYAQLRKAGFTSKESTGMKDRSWIIIGEAIRVKKEAQKVAKEYDTKIKEVLTNGKTNKS